MGSINIDLTIQVRTLPHPGQTVLATSSKRSFGGKGGNAAVAAANLHANVTMIGMVGDDIDGTNARDTLARYGVDVTGVEVAAGAPTGMALVSVDSQGENFIQVVSGANSLLTDSRVAAAVPDEPIIILANLEVADDAILEAFEKSRRSASQSVINISPMRPFTSKILHLADVVVVNEQEVSELTTSGVPQTNGEWESLRSALGVSILITTLGARGAVGVDCSGVHRATGPLVDVVDTTGCGDAFVGAFVASLADGSSLDEALALGVLVGSYSATGHGAQASYPTRVELHAWSREQRS